MDPREQFTEQYQEWKDQGGEEEAILTAFTDHLRGIGVLSPDIESALNLIDKQSATIAQLRNVVENLPFP